MFITTRGMEIRTGEPLEQATPYLKALFWLWGIKGFEVVKQDNNVIVVKNALSSIKI